MVEEVDQAALLEAEREAFTAIYGLHKSACGTSTNAGLWSVKDVVCPWCKIGHKLWDSYLWAHKAPKWILYFEVTVPPIWEVFLELEDLREAERP